MSVTSYLTIDGEIISETRSGARADYLPDPLGSTSALTNSSQTITDTYFYWPYGEIRSHSGSSTTVYTYCGTLGYRSDSVGYYVRARQLRISQTCWLTLDPMWPRQLPFTYSDLNPLTEADPSGLYSINRSRLSLNKKPTSGGLCKCGDSQSVSDTSRLVKREGSCGTVSATVTGSGGGTVGFDIDGITFSINGNFSGSTTMTCTCDVMLIKTVRWEKTCDCTPIGLYKCSPICTWNCKSKYKPPIYTRKRVINCPYPNATFELPY